jgi:hypothetical protein
MVARRPSRPTLLAAPARGPPARRPPASLSDGKFAILDGNSPELPISDGKGAAGQALSVEKKISLRRKIIDNSVED